MPSSMLTQVQLPGQYEPYAIVYAAFIKNRTKRNDQEVTHYETIYNHEPRNIVHSFGCLVVIYLFPEKRPKKLKTTKGKFGLFLGMKGNNIYKCFNFETKKVLEYYHVDFYPKFFPGLTDSKLKGENSYHY
ncbi:hypothetical protein O9G_006181 [Rozella allomycis CSF55]|uniref:Retroviral polymerase SH3-like domain-containing protein n=1 Tax=Rozella allomycis (strain CSF55) TaxID=988480 RepID=A0A075AZI5_ROZAC|nr:hypothetical protein O9G_006181 [Rozella allomycis CSF55]|eukprot:EPZ33999.1 hypothetical protein O9G_006181 [Rozella allomycis CSF55]